MKKYVLLVISVFLSTYFAIGQTFTANDYKKASWMTLRFYGGQRSSQKSLEGPNWLIMDHAVSSTDQGTLGNKGFKASSYRKGYDFTNDADGANDLSGGWFDCGDHVKFGQTEFYSAYTVLKGYDVWPAGYDDYYSYDYSGYQAAEDFSWEGKKGTPNGIPDILDEVKYACEFFIKCTPNSSTFYSQVGDGNADHSNWVTSVAMAALPKNQGGQNDGSRVITKNPNDGSMPSFCAATLALFSRLYKKFDPDFAAICLEHAKFAYTYASSKQGSTAAAGSFYPANAKTQDDFVCACAELYWATGESSYKTKALQYSNEVKHHNYCFCYANNDDLAAYNLAKLGDSHGEEVLSSLVDYYVKGVNGNGICTKGDSQWGTMRYPENAAYAVALYGSLKNSTANDKFIYTQVDYVMGNNSSKFSYIVGFTSEKGGYSSAQHPHHRNVYLTDNINAAQQNLNIPDRNKQFGFLSGGQGYDPGALMTAKTQDYTITEGGIDYNAGLCGALAYIVSKQAPVDTAKFGHPTPDLGGEKTLCGTGSVTIKATVDLSNLEPGESVSYKWYNGNTLMSANNGKTSITVTAAGTYTCELTSNTGWSTKGSVDVTATLPDVSLGDDKALCKETSATFATEVEGEGITYAWAKDGKTIAGATSKSYTAYTSGTYKLTISASGCTSKSDEVIVTSQLPEVIGDTICSAGTVNLSVKTTGEYEWYNVAEEGTALASGTTYSPSITKSTTYYVQDASSINTTAGPSYNNLQGNRTYGNNYIQVTAKSAVTITEVSAVVGSVYYASAQSLTLTVNNKDYKSKTVQLSNAGKYTFSFESNPIVLAAGSYKIDIKYDNAACSWFTNCDYNSFQHTDILTFSKGSEGDYAYPGLYDWKVFAGSTCARTPVFAVIDPENEKCASDTEAPTVPSNVTVSDVTTNSASISWTQSTDNTAVTGYDVYVNGTLYQTVTTNSLSVTDLAENTEYIVKVRAFDEAGNTSDFSSEKSFTTEKSTSTQTISLTAGWNLISFYVLPDDASVANVFGSNISKVSIVKNNDGFYKPSKASELQSLTEFKFGDAYLVKTTSAFNLTVEGKAATSTTIQLKSGWNLLGYPKATEANASTVLSSISSKYTTLKDLSSNQTKLTPGKGYYIKMNSDATITIE